MNTAHTKTNNFFINFSLNADQNVLVILMTFYIEEHMKRNEMLLCQFLPLRWLRNFKTELFSRDWVDELK